MQEQILCLSPEEIQMQVRSVSGTVNYVLLTVRSVRTHSISDNIYTFRKEVRSFPVMRTVPVCERESAR